MRIIKPLIFILSFGAVAASVYAGEDTTYRDHCVGRAYWEQPSGLTTFDQERAECGSTLRAG